MRRLVMFGALALALGAAISACFSPLRPACAFSCGSGGACPAGYLCASDGLCHRSDGQGLCLLDPADGSTPDGAAGAGP